MFEEFLRKTLRPDPRPTLSTEQRQAISDEFHRQVGLALNKAMEAGMPTRVASRYLARFAMPMVKAVLTGRGDFTGSFTIVREDGKIIVDGGYRGPLH